MTTTYPPPVGEPVSIDRPPPATPPAAPPRAEPILWHQAVRVVAAGAWVGLLVGRVVAVGVPLEREQILFWVVGSLVIASTTSGRRGPLRVLVDWVPFALVLIAYDYSRGAAAHLGIAVHWTPQRDLDRWIGGGQVPTVRLQRALIDPRRAHPWELLPDLVYVSHFIAPYVLAGVLWTRDRARWAAYVRRFVALSFLGVLIFILFPAAPPWLAARRGYLPPVARTGGRGWSWAGLHIAEKVLHRGQATVNAVAAIPSLHAGFSLLVAVTLWPTAHRLVKVLLVAYPLAMGFTLVLSGEHYVVDVVVGWVCVAATCAAVGAAERWWGRRRPSDLGAVRLRS